MLAVSRDPFVVYTSNIARILGLRSLYFCVIELLDKFHYLHYGLGALLAFVAMKMLLGAVVEIPITWSLGIMAGILGICAVASIILWREASQCDGLASLPHLKSEMWGTLIPELLPGFEANWPPVSMECLRNSLSSRLGWSLR